MRSLNELGDALHRAAVAGHVTAADIAPVQKLARRLFRAIGSLRAYLRRTPDPPEYTG